MDFDVITEQNLRENKMQTISNAARKNRIASNPYIGLLFLLFNLIFISGIKAQLSGSYGIGASGNYTTISAAVAALTTAGVSGPVIMNVAKGTFKEKISIGLIKGASATNTITFAGAGRGKSIISYTDTVLSFTSGCTYVGFTGFTITTTGTNTAVMSNTTSSCSLLNSDIAASTAATEVIYDNNTLNFTVANCHISGGSSAISINSAGATKYTGGVYKANRIVNFQYQGFLVSGANNFLYSGNVIDSASHSYAYGIESQSESGANYSNNIVIDMYEGMFFNKMNAASTSVQFQVVNNICANNQYENDFIINNSGNILIAHNTFMSLISYAVNIDIQTGVNIGIASNILISNASTGALFLDVYGGSSLGSPFNIFDGNDYYSTGGGALIKGYNGLTSSAFSYSTILAWQKAMSVYIYNNPYNNVKNSIEANSTNLSPVFISPGLRDYHLVQSVLQPSGVFAGVKTDIDGDARCNLFPTAGADESYYMKGPPSVKIGLLKNIYPGSPTYVYQTGKAYEPKSYFWYLNGVLISDSVVLFTNKFIGGLNTLKLVTISCGGKDSDQQTFGITSPTSVPVADFISNSNSIETGQNVSLQDLSSNGPTKWQWTISPDSIYNNGIKVPTFKYIFGTSSFQNPIVQFIFPGKYTVCLTSSNAVGKGGKVCKTDYITVVSSYNLGTVSVITDAVGYLYDNGGPNGNYIPATTSPYIQSVLINPCADSVYLTFSQFDLYCGFDYLRIYSGSDNKGVPLWNSKCSGSFANGPGYTGGKASLCVYQCMPNISKPDTFKAKTSIYIEMVCYEAYNSAGFAAKWWSKPRVSTKPQASFITSNAGDSVCLNGSLVFTNTTKTSSTDPATYLWDLDGDISTFECVGACPTVSFPYFLTGLVNVTLIATNCGGTDTATGVITVFNPKKPFAAFTVDNLTPTTNDIVFFTSQVFQCVDDYKWTITPSPGTNGTAVFINGTTVFNQNPQVNFTATGYYDVKMYVDNLSGAQKDSLTKTKYIHVRNPYCIPSVAELNVGIGISGVLFNTINNNTVQASVDYSNFLGNQSLSTTLALGATYPITISRDSSLIFEPINRTVYIDWNGDGSFVGTGEIVASDSNSYSANFTTKIKVPKNARIGATVMRIAVNRGTYSNKPCGQNEFGEYHDYRIYVTPYNLPPVITLKGNQGFTDTIYLEQGNHFIEPGYTATSLLYGNLTRNVIRTSRLLGSSYIGDSFSNIIPGTYIFSYNLADSAKPVPNKAITKYRVVDVTPDITPPNLVVALPDTTVIAVTKTPIHPIAIPKVISALDLVDGDLSGLVTIDSGNVHTNIVGTYKITYTVSDISGNKAIVYRFIKVVDTIAPIIKLIGNQTINVEVHTAFIDPGATATDNYYTQGILNGSIKVSGLVDTSKTGSYFITYSLTDPSGNKAISITRKVVVFDTLAPIITIIGFQNDSVEVFTPYYDQGVTVSDNYDSAKYITVTSAGTYYSNFPAGQNPDSIGSYTIVYSATDRSGNKSNATRIVRVLDHTPPVITRLGDEALAVCRWSHYVDAGYTVKDNYNKAKDLVIDILGSFITNGGTATSGIFTLYYKATDQSGNFSYSEQRIIKVKDATDITCNSSIEEGLNLEKYINIFPNPNNGKFIVKTNLNESDNIQFRISNILGKDVRIFQNFDSGTGIIQLDLSDLSGGLYFLSVLSGNQTITRRFEIVK